MSSPTSLTSYAEGAPSDDNEIDRAIRSLIKAFVSVTRGAAAPKVLPVRKGTYREREIRLIDRGDTTYVDKV